MEKNQFDYPLPIELTEEILLKVPFESILECKLVSKQWKNIINDPNFYNRYDNKSVFFISGDQNDFYCLITRHEIEFSKDQFPSLTIRPIPIKSKIDFYGDFMLSGSSNRIAWVTGLESRKFLFCNLFTGTSYSVEKAPMPKGEIGSSLHGFSYDSHEDDYKIFTLYEEDNGIFWIYSFKKPGWKSFNGFPSFYVVLNPKACSFNGVLHWLHWLAIGEKLAVITYDVHTGNFGEILLPIAPSDYRPCDVTLCELDGGLCFLHQMDDCWLMYVWVQESWKKSLHIDLQECSFLWDKLYHLTPTLLCQRKDGGKVVLFTRDYCRGLFWYDLDNNDYYEFYL